MLLGLCITAFIGLVTCGQTSSFLQPTELDRSLHCPAVYCYKWLCTESVRSEMCITTYTRDQLININNNKLVPSADVKCTLESHQLLPNPSNQPSTFKKTRRLRRGGKQARHPTVTVTNFDQHQSQVNTQNLRSLSKVVLHNNAPLLRLGVVNCCSVRNEIDHIRLRKINW